MKPKTRRAVAIGIGIFLAYGLLLAVAAGDSSGARDVVRAIVALAVMAALGFGA